MYCPREAIKRGMPAVDIECGRFGQVQAENVLLIEQMLHNLLVDLYLLPGALPIAMPSFIARCITVSSPHTWFFYSLMKAGEFIAKDRDQGCVTDLFGRPLANSLAPIDGMVLWVAFM